MSATSPGQLWNQADDESRTEAPPGLRADWRRFRYIELMREHGLIVKREPGDDSPLFACGYDPRPKERGSVGVAATFLVACCAAIFAVSGAFMAALPTTPAVSTTPTTVATTTSAHVRTLTCNNGSGTFRTSPDIARKNHFDCTEETP